jgi:glycosyltransferase involved in cell wall biosynthesis
MSCKISIVSPVYRAEKIVPELVRRIKASVETLTMDYEIVLVEDCGPDKSWQAIQEICKNDKKVKGIKLSRNFGQHYAINAGLHHSNGDWVIVMDCDLQDRPEEIPALYKVAVEDNMEVVFAQRINRQDSFFKTITSKLFYKTLEYLTGTEQDATIANFGIYKKCIIEEILTLNEAYFVFPIMVKWLGFESKKFQVQHQEREIGVSSYDFKKRLRLAVNIILSNSDRPIRIVMKLGMLISLGSFIFTIKILYSYFSGSIQQPGFTSLMISIWFLSGLILTSISVTGLYIGKVFDSVKSRPLYVIHHKINL